jgi:dipeptidyl aminopeptidase/acylaminoacyl peptidase
VSIEALIQGTYDGRDLRLGEVLATTDAYTRYFATYASGDLTISGVLNVPHGDGPFPAVVLAHGYIDPAIYTNGRGMMREQDYLARAGFVVLHTDYRNHAASSDDPDAELELRLGYTADVINAVLALKSSSAAKVDPDRLAIMGRSMGGGVTYNALVAAPGLVDAAVVYAPVSSNAAENFNRWTRGDAVADQIIAAYGAPEQNPEFWRQASPVTYFDRITEPILIQHGTGDETCPYEWSEQSLAALRRAGVDAELVTWPGEPHAFEAAWPASMQRTVEFLTEHLQD